METLYQIDVKNNRRVWNIEIICLNQIRISHGMLGGALQYKTETVPEGLGGRSLAAQVKSRIDSRVKKQLDRGYRRTILEAENSVGKNFLGLTKPMLAKPLSKVKSITYENAFIQYKYDGHRCLISKQNGIIVAYTRNGKLISSVEHILEGIELYEGQTLDGELYCHGVPLQKITSWIKREQEATINLSYNAYDSVSSKPFAERFLDLSQAVALSRSAIVVPTEKVESEREALAHFKSARAKGYEGSILRWGTLGYEEGKRSSHLVKIKEFQDAEFLVLDVDSSADGWAILVCQTGDGNQFRVSAPGSMDEKSQILKLADDYIGMMVTVEYSNITADGIPFHPVALRFREEE